MKEIGVLFSAPMVRAVDQERKTQTRRLASSPLTRLRPGTRLWVRETFRFDVKYDGAKPINVPPLATVWYEADGGVRRHFQNTGSQGKRRPAIHMPRFAARLGLMLESARVEPLHAMSTLDAWAEGIECWRPEGDDTAADWSAFPRERYALLWDSLHEKEGERWRDNPDVVVLTFSKAWVDK